MRPWLIVFAAALLTLVGCGSSGPPQQAAKLAQKSQLHREDAPAATEPAAGQEAARGGNDKEANKAAGEERVPVPGQPAGETATRKIIYNANVSLVVKDLDEAESDLKAMLKEFAAFVANSELTGSAGSPRSGHWRVRVPVEHFDEFMAALVKLGVPQRNTTDSQDVTEEYYDLADRIKNKKLEQETLRGYLQEKKATSKLEEILTIEKELSRVRGELDQMEGRLRRLKDVTALATVSVTMQEVKDYVPPQAPTFGSSVRGTFADSLDLLVRFGQGVVLVAVALGPWLAVLALVAVPGWRVGRRYWKKARGLPTAGDRSV
jgi:hypothetical protein